MQAYQRKKKGLAHSCLSQREGILHGGRPEGEGVRSKSSSGKLVPISERGG